MLLRLMEYPGAVLTGCGCQPWLRGGPQLSDYLQAPAHDGRQACFSERIWISVNPTLPLLVQALP